MFEPAAPVGGPSGTKLCFTSYSRPGALLPCLTYSFLLSSTAVSLLLLLPTSVGLSPAPPVAPPPPIPLDTIDGGCAALPTQLCLSTPVSSAHESYT